MDILNADCLKYDLDIEILHDFDLVIKFQLFSVPMLHYTKIALNWLILTH